MRWVTGQSPERTESMMTLKATASIKPGVWLISRPHVKWANRFPSCSRQFKSAYLILAAQSIVTDRDFSLLPLTQTGVLEDNFRSSHSFVGVKILPTLPPPFSTVIPHYKTPLEQWFSIRVILSPGGGIWHCWEVFWWSQLKRREC